MILLCLTSCTDLLVKDPHDGAQGRDDVLLQVSGPSNGTLEAMLAQAENTLHNMQANCEMHQAVTLHSLDSNARHESEVNWLYQTCLSVIRHFETAKNADMIRDDGSLHESLVKYAISHFTVG